jgi:ParB-like chromosome segregation protein Spo0J
VVKVPIKSLRQSDSPRLSGENEEHALILAQSEDKFPPIIVQRTTMRVVDGMHRLRAAALRGEDQIEVRFFDGSEADAFVLAVEANITHGLPLSLSDRKAAAARIIGSHPHWSDRVVAAATGLSHKTVGAIRQRPSGEIPQTDVRVGHDGRVRPLNAAKGRMRAGELMTERPHASLRQIAQEAGISVETARSVRNRLNDGEDPVLPPRPRARRKGRAQAKLASQNQCKDAGSAPEADLSSILRKLRSDPSVRLNETGRILLRLLGAHPMNENQWGRLIESVPRHRVETVADAAYHCADAWQRFGDRLTTQ